MATSAGEVDETRRLFDSGPEYASLLQRPTARQLSPGSRRRHDPLSTWQAIAYALPSLAVAAQYLPTHIHVFKFYTDTLMVPAGSLAVGTAVARAMDCLIDPIVGWISDNTESSWGRRKPYILASLPFNAIAYYLLFTPSSTLAGHAATQWFTFFFFLFLAVPLSLPYYSLGPELTSDNAGRVRLFVYAEVWDKVGIIFAAILPSLLIVAFHGDIRRAYSDAALIIGGLTILTFSTLLIFVEEPQRPREILRNVKSSQFVPGIRRAMRNAPYRLLMYAATIGTLSHAVTNVIVTYYVACVIRVDGPEEFLGTVLCTFFIPAALSIPVWHFLARITDTRRAWLIGWASHVPICAAAFTLGPGQVKPFLVITGCMGVSYGGSFLSKAMISDAIDYQELRTGSRSEGQFLAWMTLIPKLTVIPASSIPLVIMSSTGYVPNTAVQNPGTTMALRVMFGLLPCVLSSITFIIAYQYPITGAVQERIQRMVAAQHDNHRALIDPISGAAFTIQHGFSMDMDHFSSDELYHLAQANGWMVVHRRLVRSLVMWTASLVLSVAIGISTFSELSTVLATCLASVSVMMIGYHAFRLRALYDFTDESQAGLKANLEQMMQADQY